MLGWLRWLVDLLRLLASRISGRRYDVLARRIGRTEEAGAPPERRRFIVIQIDGLAHTYLEQAMALGFTPALQRLLAQGYSLHSWRCGVPSSTPSIQAGIMYGDNWDLPAFRWYEKADGFAPTCRNPAHLARIKLRIQEGRQGLLVDGSSYGNMFDGDAQLALFTLSAMGRHRFFEHLRGLGWALLFVLNPWSTLRTVGLTVWELLRDLARTIAKWVRGGFRSRLVLTKPFLKVLANVIFGQIQTFGILLDVYRGMPAIYANFYGYDEVAHEDGPLGREALRALKRIDAHIRQINHVRQTYWPEMELYVLSDHGMTPSVPFHAAAHQTLGEFVARHVRTSVLADQPRHDALDDPNLRFMLDELDGIESHLSRRGQRLAQVLRKRIRRQVTSDDDSGWDLARGSDVVVRSSGSLAHIYFNVTAERMSVSEIAILYADLIDALNDHPDIGLVLGTEEGRPVAVTAHGTLALSAEWLPPGLADPEQTAADLARVVSFPHSGDLVLLGALGTARAARLSPSRIRGPHTAAWRAPKNAPSGSRRRAQRWTCAT